jgi:hypothetical protein
MFCRDLTLDIAVLCNIIKHNNSGEPARSTIHKRRNQEEKVPVQREGP